MRLGERIAAARAFDAARFLPFAVDGRIVGRVRCDFAARLSGFPQVFALGERIEFVASLDSPERRTRAMAEVACALAGAGLLTPWRDETYAIQEGADGAPLFHLERAAVRFFGFSARAVHVNGLTGQGRGMWIARRSAHKAIDPGLFDTLVGGGIASGLSVEQTLAKEAWEEAGIDASLAARATAAGLLRVCHEVPDGLHAETLYVYDLMLPDDFQPLNQDGEVQEFRCLDLDEVVHELQGDAQYTIDAGLVVIDCLVRHGRVAGVEPFSSRD